MASNNLESTNWSLNSDIYDIEDTLLDIKKRYIEDETESTLALGIFGYLTDIEAKKIQTSVVMAGQMGNEIFPARAKLTKNVISHAIYNNINGINAVPAEITANICLKLEDINLYIRDGKFTIDCTSPIFIEDYEFHFDYDVILQRSMNPSGEYSYSAHYDMSNINRVSTITEPYLMQPFTFVLDNIYYVAFQATLRQYTIEETSDKIISDSIIENKTFTFEFENQLSDFDVYVTSNGVTTRLTPYLYGSAVETDKYCWYLYISDNTVRITFDAASYTPGLNADILIRAYTTLGSDGNFSYQNIDGDDAGLYIDIKSDKYGYDTMTCYMLPVSNSVNGSNKKSKAELQKLLPKMASSRGNITTEQDLINYFNLIDTEDQRIVLQKKVDNQLSRVWYSYFVLKDSINNIIPTNTINIKIDVNSEYFIHTEDNRYMLPAGTTFKLNKDAEYAEIVDVADVPELYSDEYFGDDFYYMTLHNIMIDEDPLYAAYYMTITNKNKFFTFNWVNESSIMQFVSTKCNFKRSLLTNQSEYKINFNMAQSIASDFGLYVEDPTTHEITNNMACVLVLYKDDIPYRWDKGTLISYDKNNYVSNWSFTLTTDNGFDTYNNIRLLNLYVHGSATDRNYGYFYPNTKAVLYTLAKFADGEYGRYDLDTIAPGYEDYTVTNVYNINEGLNLYENYTNVMSTKITPIVDENSEGEYIITSIPMVGMHYVGNDASIVYLTNALNDKKAYIDNCLKLIENNTDIDFKFFNTYGPSKTYTIGDAAQTPIGNIDITIKFRLSIKSTTDIYTKDDVLSFIKKYIEDINDIGNLHIPNLITKISNEFADRINYIEYMSFNDFWLGVQHIIKKDTLYLDTVPEILNIRNHYNAAGSLVPWIDLEVLYS